ncbi:MAG: hypothetical protein ACK4N4_06640 [Burkholderiales bacterium]
MTNMQCTLLVPHLLLPDDAAKEACRGLTLAALPTLLARARRQSFAPLGVEAWLCQAFEVEKQQDWPVAPLTLALDGGDPGAAYWLRADPVHLRLRREQLLLAGGDTLHLSQQEADQLVAALNRHFAADGLQFVAPCAIRWYLRPASAPAITTCALSEVTGTDVNSRLPAGEDALRWHQIWNEIQMLLHDHPLNAAREARGAMPVNSVWLWGGGSRPAVAGRHFSAVWSNETLACALAARADRPAAPLPDDAGHWFAAIDPSQAENARPLLVLDALSGAAQYGDLQKWREEIAALERNWFAPLLAALRRRHLARVTLVTPGIRSCERFELTPADLLKIWRRARALSAYCAA